MSLTIRAKRFAIVARNAPTQGPRNGAFGKPCPCPRGHPPFSSFSSFHGVRAAKPLLYWLECRFVIFAIFVKNLLFSGGTKARSTKSTVFGTPTNFVRKTQPLSGQRAFEQSAKRNGKYQRQVFFGEASATPKFRRVTSTPDPDIFEKYRDTPPVSIAILLRKYALPLAESSIYTTNLYRDTPPICIAILLQKY